MILVDTDILIDVSRNIEKQVKLQLAQLLKWN